MKKRVLGKGLDAIIPRSPEGKREYEQIALSKISVNPNQPRRKFDQDALAELAGSIKEKGVIQPVIVRKTATGYELVAGERRLRAAKAAGVERMPAIVRKVTEGEALELSIIENVQREDLGPLEIGEAYSSLSKEFGLSHEDISKKVGKDRTSVSNYIRLLKLPTEIRKGLIEGLINFGHGKALLSIPGDDMKREAYKKIIKGGLSVREAERVTRKKAKKVDKAHKTADSYGMSLEMRGILESIQRFLGARVRMKGSEKKGILEIHYSSPEELDGIIRKLK